MQFKAKQRKPGFAARALPNALAIFSCGERASHAVAGFRGRLLEPRGMDGCGPSRYRSTTCGSRSGSVSGQDLGKGIEVSMVE
jgi:hypothetical protein